MAIRVVCPSCGRGGKVPDAARGADIRCPACGVTSPFEAVLAVEPPPPAPPSSPLLSSRARAGRGQAPPPAVDRGAGADAGPTAWRPREEPGGDRLIVAPPPSNTSALLQVALGICGVAMLMMLGVIIYLTQIRGAVGRDGDAIAAPAAPAVDPAGREAPEAAFLPGKALGPGAEAPEVPVAGGVGPGRPGGGEPAEVAADARIEPPAEVDPVDLPGRPLTTAEIVERCEPSVALIEGATSTGTGFLVAPGLLATNAHVIESELISALGVRFPSAPAEHAGPMPAELLFEDPERDLAFLRVRSTLPPLVVAAEHRYVKGEDVTVIGNPGVGGELILENAISKGVMSSRAVIDGQEYIQLGIAINPGNSGGPVFDARGEVIGVATLKTAKEEALGFIIPVADLNRAIDRVKSQPEAAANRAAARHRPAALFHSLVAAGALHAIGLDRHVLAWNDAKGGGSIRQIIADDPDLKTIRADLDEFHAEFAPRLNAESTRIRRDPDVPGDVREAFTRLASNYAQFRQLLERPPDDFGTLLRLVASAESTHLDLAKTLGDRLAIEVDEGLLAALAPLQVESGDPGRALDAFPGLPPGFGSFRGRFGFPSIPRPPGIGPYGRFGPGFP